MRKIRKYKPRNPKFQIGQEVTSLHSGKHGTVIDVWWDYVENRYLVSVRARDIEKGIWSIAESRLKLREESP